MSMKATGTDALNLIRHWKEERAQMQCTCASEGAGFQMACEALIPLDGVSYHYHGSQDIPSAMKTSLEGTLVSVLELRSSQWGHGGHGRGANRLVAGGTPPVGGTRGGGRWLVSRDGGDDVGPGTERPGKETDGSGIHDLPRGGQQQMVRGRASR